MLCQIRSNQFVKSICSGMDWSFEVFYFTKSKLAYGLILSMRLTVIQMNISWLWHVKEFWGIFPRHTWNISLQHWARGEQIWVQKTFKYTLRVCCYHLLHDGEAILCRDVFNASWDRCFKHQNESSKKGPCFYQEIWHFRIMTPSNKFFFHRFLRNTKKMDLPDSWL